MQPPGSRRTNSKFNYYPCCFRPSQFISYVCYNSTSFTISIFLSFDVAFWKIYSNLFSSSPTFFSALSSQLLNLSTEFLILVTVLEWEGWFDWNKYILKIIFCFLSLLFFIFLAYKHNLSYMSVNLNIWILYDFILLSMLVLIYGILFSCVSDYYIWKKNNCRNNVRTQKRIFICFCQELGGTTKLSSTEAAGSSKGYFPSGSPFLRGYNSFQTLQSGRNWFWSLSFCPRRLPKPQLSPTAVKAAFNFEPKPRNFQFMLNFG